MSTIKFKKMEHDLTKWIVLVARVIVRVNNVNLSILLLLLAVMKEAMRVRASAMCRGAEDSYDAVIFRLSSSIHLLSSSFWFLLCYLHVLSRKAVVEAVIEG